MWRLQLSGYPAQDYDSNQIPRKTELCLSLSGQDFEKYISEVLYPNLAGKKFDIYKIDKQRRLIDPASQVHPAGNKRLQVSREPHYNSLRRYFNFKRAGWLSHF